MKRLLAFVKEAPAGEKPSHKATCPFCSSQEVNSYSSESTLVGNPPGKDGIDDDCNHVWTRFACNHCGEKFTRETKSGNVWYTKGKKVLKGMPSCFEDYIYTCRCCGGEVRRKHKCLNSDEEPVMLTFKDGKKLFRIFFECKGCGKSIQTPEDHWWPTYRKRPSKGKQKRARKQAMERMKKWTIVEEIGVVVINDEAVAKVNITTDESSTGNNDSR